MSHVIPAGISAQSVSAKESFGIESSVAEESERRESFARVSVTEESILVKEDELTEELEMVKLELEEIIELEELASEEDKESVALSCVLARESSRYAEIFSIESVSFGVTELDEMLCKIQFPCVQRYSSFLSKTSQVSPSRLESQEIKSFLDGAV